MNIQQASIYSGKSEKTLRRWISKGDLPATLIEGRYEIDAGDLDALLVQPAPDTLSARIDALESRIESLETVIREMADHPPMRRVTTPRPVYETQGTLPEGLVSIVDLIKEHGAPETSVMRNMRPYLKTGPWHTGDGRVVKYALDDVGQAEFLRRYGSE